MRRTSDPDRAMLRLGGTAAIVGSLMGMVGNLIHPETPINDKEGVARVIADSSIWVPVHLVIIFGIVLMLAGLVAVRQPIKDGIAAAFARLGVVAAIVGGSIGVVLVILDGVAARQLAQEWAASSPGAAGIALELVHLNETINFALASSFNFVFAAATFILFGLAVAKSEAYPGWLGWVAVAAGVVSVVAGVIQASVGEPTEWSRILTIIGPTVITLWLLIMGILLLRKAGERPEEALAPIETTTLPRVKHNLAQAKRRTR